MNVIFDQAVANCTASIRDGQARVTREELPTVRGDLSQLTQLLQDLIGNAVKFRKPDVPPEIHVGSRRDGEYWQFWIQDNGIGISPNQVDRIFRVFQRLHTQDQYPGTGLGLAICKKIVERHGGRIWAESQPGQGSTFRFTLPEGRTAALNDASTMSAETCCHDQE